MWKVRSGRMIHVCVTRCSTGIGAFLFASRILYLEGRFAHGKAGFILHRKLSQGERKILGSKKPISFAERLVKRTRQNGQDRMLRKFLLKFGPWRKRVSKAELLTLAHKNNVKVRPKPAKRTESAGFAEHMAEAEFTRPSNWLCAHNTNSVIERGSTIRFRSWMKGFSVDEENPMGGGQGYKEKRGSRKSPKDVISARKNERAAMGTAAVFINHCHCMTPRQGRSLLESTCQEGNNNPKTEALTNFLGGNGWHAQKRLQKGSETNAINWRFFGFKKRRKQSSWINLAQSSNTAYPYVTRKDCLPF